LYGIVLLELYHWIVLLELYHGIVLLELYLCATNVLLVLYYI